MPVTRPSAVCSRGILAETESSCDAAPASQSREAGPPVITSGAPYVDVIGCSPWAEYCRGIDRLSP
ncbi:MAG: hypothetical protein ACI8Y4_002971 [Candidatus Poriferisodalaceae bacterium]|jgi:hypothetical protein